MIPAPRSLLARILMWHALAVVVTALAVSASVYLFLDATADHLERQTLRAQVGAARKALELTQQGTSALSVAEHDGLPLLAGMNVLVVDRSRLLANFSSVRLPLAVETIPRRGAEAYFTKRSRHSLYAGLSVPVDAAGRRVWIVAIQNLDHPANVIDDLVRQFLSRGLAIVLPLLLLLLGVDAIIVRRALGSVRRASALAQTIDATRGDVRLGTPALPAEVRPLADAVDRALGRLTDSLRSVRAFTADAAHELRTPLTVARVRVTEITDPVLRGALIADLDRLAGTIAHLLDIAELDAITDLMTQPVDLSELAEKELASIAPLAFRQGKTLELLRPQGVNLVSADPHLLASAVAALLENAVRHTRAGTHIIVDTRNARAFSVVDDGDGIALSDQDLVFRRFWRRDRASADSSGLGLSIVQRVAEVHGGTVTLSSSLGHTEFSVRLPG